MISAYVRIHIRVACCTTGALTQRQYTVSDAVRALRARSVGCDAGTICREVFETMRQSNGAYFAYPDSSHVSAHGLSGESRDTDLTVTSHTDAGHGGDKLTSHSVSGADALITGQLGSRALIAWKAKHQPGAVSSTGASEISASCLGLKDIGLP